MSLLAVVLFSAVVLSIAYVTYGRVLARLLRLDPNKPTPAVELNDGLDFEPIESKFLPLPSFGRLSEAGTDGLARLRRLDSCIPVIMATSIAWRGRPRSRATCTITAALFICA